MSDVADEFGFYADQLLQKSKTNPLRDRMRRFADEHDDDTDLKQVRKLDTDSGSLSSIVIDEREERF